jgi:hypothetical protein
MNAIVRRDHLEAALAADVHVTEAIHALRQLEAALGATTDFEMGYGPLWLRFRLIERGLLAVNDG